VWVGCARCRRLLISGEVAAGRDHSAARRLLQPHHSSHGLISRIWSAKTLGDRRLDIRQPTLADCLLAHPRFLSPQSWSLAAGSCFSRRATPQARRAGGTPYTCKRSPPPLLRYVMTASPPHAGNQHGTKSAWLSRQRRSGADASTNPSAWTVATPETHSSYQRA